MAKQCIYCGQLLAKENARFCNECGRSQVQPADAEASQAAPAAIRVKLPPKEFTRVNPSASWPEPTADVTPLSSPPEVQTKAQPPSRPLQSSLSPEMSAKAQPSSRPPRPSLSPEAQTKAQPPSRPLKSSLSPEAQTKAQPPSRPLQPSLSPEVSTKAQPPSRPLKSSLSPEAQIKAQPPSRPLQPSARPGVPKPSGTADNVESEGDALAAMARLANSVQSAGPTPAEEISTMVLPNWREELAQLRKEQEQSKTDPLVPPEKKAERAKPEPPPLSRRPASAPLPPRELAQKNTRTPALFSEAASSIQMPQDAARPVEAPPRIPQKPVHGSGQSSSAQMPQDTARPIEAPPRIPQKPVPGSDQPRSRMPQTPPSEGTRSTEATRRELHVKVWEQETTVHYSPPEQQASKPARQASSFTGALLDQESQAIEIDALETVDWQAPLGSVLSGQPGSVAREEMHVAVEEESSRPPIQAERQLARGISPLPEPPQVKGENQRPEPEKPTPVSAESRPPIQEEKPVPVREEARPPLGEQSNRPAVKTGQPDIEDLPTAPLAVPEAARQGMPITIERASTPAPKKWAMPPTDAVEDLPTRPITASTAGSAAARGAQPPVMRPAQSGEQRSEPELAEAVPPSAQNVSAPSSLPGINSLASAIPATEAPADPLASRRRPVAPNAQPGQAFNPASLPPLPPGPPSMPGNTQLRSEVQSARDPQPRMPMPSPDAPAQRAPWPPTEAPGPRPPSPSLGLASPPSSTPSSAPALPAATGTELSRRKRSKRPLVVVLLLLVLLGGGTGVVLNWSWIAQYFVTPAANQPYETYQNSTFGISLNYIQSWSVKTDQAHDAVHFADSSRTGQVNVTIATASGQVGDYLNQQAAQLGVSGLKTSPAASFAGSSWQVEQGLVTQSGATYAIMLYATQHNGRFYMLAFLAPQSVFTHMDQSDFTQMRSSFSFI